MKNKVHCIQAVKFTHLFQTQDKTNSENET